MLSPLRALKKFVEPKRGEILRSMLVLSGGMDAMPPSFVNGCVANGYSYNFYTKIKLCLLPIFS